MNPTLLLWLRLLLAPIPAIGHEVTVLAVPGYDVLRVPEPIYSRDSEVLTTDCPTSLLVYGKGAAFPTQTLRVVLAWCPTEGESLIGSVWRDDFDFDGREDIAILTQCGGAPTACSHDVFLRREDGSGFEFNPSITETLTHKRYSQVDRVRKRIVIMHNSGYTRYWTEEYSVRGRQVRLERRDEDYNPNLPDSYRVKSRRVGHRWVVTAPPHVYLEGEVPEGLELELKSSRWRH